MRATEILRQELRESLSFLHVQQANVLWRVVEALLVGGALWLTALGRALGGRVSPKHSIKCVDRFLGNRAIYRARLRIYAALARLTLGRTTRPVVLVDITEIRPNVCALTASVAMSGRSVPVYGQVRRKVSISKPDSIARFLRDLKSVLPNNVRPIVVTDAGFESPWFDRLEALGWDYVGRVRHQTRFLYAEQWVGVERLHEEATNHARCLGQLAFPKHRGRSAKSRRIVVAAAPESKRRVRKNTQGRKGRTVQDRRYAKSAKEPWLLATSLDIEPAKVVSIYALRMQIEQNYRDTKNARWGWQLSNSLSRSNRRLEMLLLVAAIAMVIALGVGCEAESRGEHRRHQANTVRHRRVLSLFLLGLLVLDACGQEIPVAHFRSGLRKLQTEIRRLPPGPDG